MSTFDDRIIPPRAQELIDRLAAVDLERPVLDRAKVERAIAAHLQALGVPARPVRWFEDALAARAALDALAALAARAALDARDARAALDARDARAALDARDARAALAARDARAALAALDALAARDARDALDALDALAALAARAALDALAAYNFYYYRFNAFYSAREAVYWVAACAATQYDLPEVQRLAGIWLPCVEAYEAGLWLYWIFETEVVVVSRPAMRVQGDQLHCETGPAVSWPTGEEYYFLNGVEVSKEIVMTPAGELSAQLLLSTRNAEVRRELVRKIGIERICVDLHAHVVEKEDIYLPAYDGPAWDDQMNEMVMHHVEAQTLRYELLTLDLGDGIHRPYLKMLNPSIGVWHIEGVAPGIRTVREALNWRNGLTPEMIDDVNGADWFQQGDVILRPRGARKFKSLPVVLA